MRNRASITGKLPTPTVQVRQADLFVSEQRQVQEETETVEPQEFDSLPVIVSGQLLSDIPEFIEAEFHSGAARPLSIPSAVTGVCGQRYGAERYVVVGKKGGVWTIDLQAEAIGSPLDVALSVLDAQGTELKRSDDLPGTTDAGLEFVVPADGSYELTVSDSSGRSGSRAATYRLAVRHADPSFTLHGPEFVNVPLGGKTGLTLKATRVGGFKDPINLRIEGLPDGVAVPEQTILAAGKNDVKITLSAAADAGTAATLLRVSGHAVIGQCDVTKRLAHREWW